ncbi:hypothetical protein FAUST_6603 [Fusarium austroamericanum]|uniref:NB-ARC domain-containing protein n=1 Tax=Fusarium austroamericanum TaxID=282268 RepID=A0AAN5Z9Y2_FUSAU|nr:hypothetical protein FAUST_6603 [Fusarium austroamericanum]
MSFRQLVQPFCGTSNCNTVMDPSSDINSYALEILSDDFMRREVLTFANRSFPSLFHNLLQGNHSPVLVPQLLACTSLLSGFLFMAVYQAARRTQESAGRSEDSFCRLIDKLRRCSDLGSIFYSRCSDSRVPPNHAKERLSQAYRLHLSFISTIVDVFEWGPLESPDDERWNKIEKHENECNMYLQESEAFLFNTLEDQCFQGSSNTVTPKPELISAIPSVYLLPKRPARFYGRQDDLAKIRQKLGVLKSITSEYKIILWMRSSPTTALDQGCVDALVRFGVVKQGMKPGVENRQKWKDYLSQSAVPWLIIFDNVDQADDLHQLWPMDGNGKIIITTRSPMVGYGLTEDEIPICTFTEEEGQQCIIHLTSWPGGAPADPDSARELNNELGGLPIGIVQMTALMRYQRTPIKKFLGRYKEDRLKFHSKDITGITGIYPDIKPKIATNWNLSFNALGDEAKSLLGILSFLSPDAIPQELFNHWDGSVSRSTQDLLGYCQTFDEYADIIHYFEYFLDVPARQRAFDQAAKLLCDAFPQEHIGQRFTGRWPDCAMYLFEVADYTNFRTVVEGGIKACNEVPKDRFDEVTWCMLNYNAGTVETSVGRFNEAKLYLDRALEVRRRLGNSDDIAAALNNLGLLHNSMHEYEVAKKYYSEALEIHLGRPDSQDRNLSLNMVKHNLQRNAIQEGRYLPSIEDLQGTVAFFKSTPSWWMTGHACLVFGNLLYKGEQYIAAEKAFAEARDILAAPGRAGKQPAVAMVIYKLGCVAFRQGEYNKAA